MIRIIPAIDLIDGKCVRLQKGDYSTKKIYNEDPLEVAKSFEAHGIKHLHLVDLDGAKAHQIINHKVLECIAKNTSLNIDFGGGIKSAEMLQIAFDCGADQVSIGSLAVKDPPVFFDWLKTFGSDKIILSADAMNKKIATNGWLEDSGIDLIPFLAKYYTKGVKYATVTDISKDGMLQGANRVLYQEIANEINDLNLIVSGGIKDIKDVDELASDNFFGVIIGKAIYEGKIDLKDLERFVI